MRNVKKQINMLILLLLPLVGCSDGDGSSVTVLEGTWATACLTTGLSVAPYTIHTYIFSGNKTTNIIKNYSDSGCTTPTTLNNTVTYLSNFTVGAGLTTAGNLAANELDLYLELINGEPLPAGEQVEAYTIFSITPNGLYFGYYVNGLDGTSPTLRPNTLNFDRAFILQ